MELVETLISERNIHMVIKIAVFPIMNAIAHFMILPRYNEYLWSLDPNHFV